VLPDFHLEDKQLAISDYCNFSMTGRECFNSYKFQGSQIWLTKIRCIRWLYGNTAPSWLSSACWKITAFCSPSCAMPRLRLFGSSTNEWVSPLVLVARGLVSVGNCVPFPYVNTALSSGLALLELIQVGDQKNLRTYGSLFYVSHRRWGNQAMISNTSPSQWSPSCSYCGRKWTRIPQPRTPSFFKSARSLPGMDGLCIHLTLTGGL
jgi:hypothetical protein